MTPYEEIWVLIGVGIGLLLFFEGAISYATKSIARILKRPISEDAPKMIAGVIIFTLAIFKLNPALLWMVLGLSLLLILCIIGLMIFPSRKEKRKRVVMKLKITKKKEREIEYWVKAFMYLFGVGLGSATLVGIWNTLGLIDSWGWALQVVSILFLATATAAFCFEVKHLCDERRSN